MLEGKNETYRKSKSESQKALIQEPFALKYNVSRVLQTDSFTKAVTVMYIKLCQRVNTSFIEGERER
jgi:hypothetical protein